MFFLSSFLFPIEVQDEPTSIQTIQRFSTSFTPLVQSRYVEAEILMAATGHTLPPWKVFGMQQFYQQLEGDDVTILGPSSEVLGDFSRCVVRLLSIFPNKYCICCIIHFKTTMPVTTLKKEMSEPLPALCRAPPRLCKPQIGAKGHSITKRHHSKSSAKFIIFVPLILMVSFTSWAPSPVKV